MRVPLGSYTPRPCLESAQVFAAGKARRLAALSGGCLAYVERTGQRRTGRDAALENAAFPCESTGSWSQIPDQRVAPVDRLSRDFDRSTLSRRLA